MRKNLILIGVRSPGRPSRSELLYRLSYSGLPLFAVERFNLGRKIIWPSVEHLQLISLRKINKSHTVARRHLAPHVFLRLKGEGGGGKIYVLMAKVRL